MISKLFFNNIVSFYCLANCNKITSNDIKQIELFANLIKKIYSKNNFKINISQNLSIEKIIRDFIENQFDEKKFPLITRNNTPNKLIIFMIGGISYNELFFTEKNQNIFLCSDSLINPKIFFETLNSVNK